MMLEVFFVGASMSSPSKVLTKDPRQLSGPDVLIVDHMLGEAGMIPGRSTENPSTISQPPPETTASFSS